MQTAASRATAARVARVEAEERLRPEWQQRSGLRLSSGRWGGGATGGRQLAATASRASSMLIHLPATQRDESSRAASVQRQHISTAAQQESRQHAGARHKARTIVRDDQDLKRNL